MKKGHTQIGKTVSIIRKIRETDLEKFAELSLDRNAVHFNEKFAVKTLFGNRIAHGMLGASLMSGALTKLLGDGNIWLFAKINYDKPIFIGDTLTCKLTIEDIDRRGIATLLASIQNDNGIQVISGELRSMRCCTAVSPQFRDTLK